MNARNLIALDFSPRGLRAVLAARGSRGALIIRRRCEAVVPAEFDSTDAEQYGRWAGEQLRAAGFPRGRATIVLGREQVALKRLTLPTTESAELPDMTRLTLQRDLPVEPESAVIDFLPLERTDTATTVLAVATTRRVIEQAQLIARHAGFTIDRIALRTLGAAALVRSLPEQPAEVGIGDATSPANGSTFIIDVASGGSVELTFAVNGHIHTSRSTTVPPPADRLATVEHVVTEARRTWMSAVGSAAPDGVTAVNNVILMGDSRVCAYAAEPLRELLNVPVTAVQEHPRLVFAQDYSPDVDGLIGVLLEQIDPHENRIDLAQPRRAPDVAARQRQRRLLAAGLALVVLVGGWTAGRMHLRSLQRTAEELDQQRRQQIPLAARYWRDDYKLTHLKQWESSAVHWLDHATYLASIAPPPQRLVLDAWEGRLAVQGVKYDKTTGTWSVLRELAIQIDGEARDRETADGFRDALVRSNGYETKTPGADARGGKRMPFGFTYTLKAKTMTPPGASGAKPVVGDQQATGSDQRSALGTQHSLPSTSHSAHNPQHSPPGGST